MTLRILLINAPISLNKVDNTIEKLHNASPPLGLAYLAGMVREMDVVIKIVDAHLYNMGSPKIREEIKSFNPDMVGISCTTASAKSAGEISKITKGINEKTMVVAGGPHITAVRNEFLEVFSDVDVGIAGDGEEIFKKLVENILGKKDYTKTPGVIYRKNKKILNNPLPSFVNLDEIPFPAWDLLPSFDNYLFQPAVYRRKPHTFVVASRGCPYRCVFCHVSKFRPKIRFRSPKNVVDEVEYLIKNYGIKEIRFADELFTARRSWAMDVCDEIIRRKLNISWTCDIRAEQMNVELAKKLKEAGCWSVSMGVESGSQKILDRIKKDITLEQVNAAIKNAHIAGMTIRAFFMLGFPFENRKDIEDTINFASKSKLDFAQFSYVIPFPGTEIYDICRSRGSFGEHGWMEYNASEYDRPVVIPEGMKEEELVKLFKKAYRKFYISPLRWIQMVKGIKNFDDLKRYMRGAKALISL